MHKKKPFYRLNTCCVNFDFFLREKRSIVGRHRHSNRNCLLARSYNKHLLDYGRSATHQLAGGGIRLLLAGPDLAARTTQGQSWSPSLSVRCDIHNSTADNTHSYRRNHEEIECAGGKLRMTRYVTRPFWPVTDGRLDYRRQP